MIKFIHKKHINTKTPGVRFVIYYSFSDIILGFLLVMLTGFFAVSYVHDHLSGEIPAAVSYAVPTAPSSAR